MPDATPRPAVEPTSGDALLTDFYQLTMVHGYHAHGMRERAVFEFFVRRLPDRRRFLVAAGLEPLLDYLEGLRFGDDELAWLDATGHFDRPFLDYLSRFRFTGDVDAMPEGTVCFADEPLVRVSAPLPEAQFIESRLINLVHLQTLIASKAVRCVLAAPGRQLVDFGMRRAHGAEAAVAAARAAYLAGFSGSATVAAGHRYGIPLYGTMAHSFIEAYDSELDAFRDFAVTQPDNVVLLIDTYDIERAAHRVVDLADELSGRGIRVKAVRIDSGDLRDGARRVRDILDAAGRDDIGIFVSGNLDEYVLARLCASATPITGFGVGTHMTTSQDVPCLDCAYKLQEYAGQPRRKRSPGKATWPGRKQVWRRYDDRGRPLGDTVTLADEAGPPDARPLLQPVMRGGVRVDGASPPLEAIRESVARQLAALPEPLRRLSDATRYPVSIAASLQRLADDIDRRMAGSG